MITSPPGHRFPSISTNPLHPPLHLVTYLPSLGTNISRHVPSSQATWKTQKGLIQALTLGGKDKHPTQLHRATEELCAHRPASGPSGSPRWEGGGLPLPSTHGLCPPQSSSAARWAARQETGVASMRFSNWGQGRNLNCGQLCLLKILISWCRLFEDMGNRWGNSGNSG